MDLASATNQIQEMEQNLDTTHAYTWGIPLTVAFLDILGFCSAMKHIRLPQSPSEVASNSGDLTFNLWKNCLPQRTALSHTPKLNFVQMSDSLVVYGESHKDVLKIVCDTFGAALVWGVPIRAGLGYGILNHAESFQRPGTILTFYGDGLTDAYQTEQARGVGMRLLLSKNFLSQTATMGKTISHEETSLTEYPWWQDCGVEPIHFAERVETWRGAKRVNQWFTGRNREDTEQVFNFALGDLKKKTVTTQN